MKNVSIHPPPPQKNGKVEEPKKVKTEKLSTSLLAVWDIIKHQNSYIDYTFKVPKKVFGVEVELVAFKDTITEFLTFSKISGQLWIIWEK